MSDLINENGHPCYWMLYYRYGNIPQLIKGFKFDGTLAEATIRGRQHCKVMNYLYHCVRPLVVDLDYQETQYLSHQLLGTEESEIER